MPKDRGRPFSIAALDFRRFLGPALRGHFHLYFTIGEYIVRQIDRPSCLLDKNTRLAPLPPYLIFDKN